jgi:hypothetical protein
VTTAFATAARHFRATESELRRAVCDYTALLRAADAPPEQVLVAIKQLLREVAGGMLDPEEYRQLLDRVVRWCINSYYGPRPARRATSSR